MIVAADAAFGVVVLALSAVLFLLRHLVLPVQRLTAIVTRIADGDLAAEVPERGRRDEIGAMAAAIEIFKANAVELRRTNLLFDAALNNMSQGLAMYDRTERLVVTNGRFCQVTGLPLDGVRLGMAYRDVLALALRAGHFPGRMLDDVYAERRSLAYGRAERILDDIGDGRVIAVSYEPLAGGGWVCTFEDITGRRRAEAQIAHLAHHDALTNLPNRTLFRKRLEEALARARRGEGFALLCLDLDRFKEVNDTLGHPVGDALLRAVTKRLQAHVRETDTVARLGGDEFAIVQVSADQPRDAAAFAQRLVEAIGRPYEVEGHHIVVGASVGIALGPGDGANPDELLKNADLALYRAKADGRAAWRLFLREMDARVQARRLLEMDLRRALAGSELELHYQPLVHLRLRRPTGLEALIRWRHPERGLVPPADFIPLAEEIGLIVPIGEWIMQRACTEAATWLGAPKVAVNVSAAQFRRGSALVETVAHALRASGLPPARLEIEITETAMLHDTEETFAALHRIRQMGVSIALDDFGTGFSSLSYLRRFPFNRVKIDRSFVEDLRRNDGAALVRAVVGLCRDLGMAITAEGVETEEQLKWLAAEGVTDAQGYLFSQPVPAAMVPTVLGAPVLCGSGVGA
jgi:diguanylate cyclase (GGDEF)-like protein